MAGLRPPELRGRHLRRVALIVQRILLGERPGDIPVDFSLPGRLTLNMKTARAIGVSPSWELLVEADVLEAGASPDVSTITLWQAMEEGVAANLDLEAERQGLVAAAQEVKVARSILLPQVELSALGVEIDEDRAAASLGAARERSLLASASLSQLLYSDAAWGNITVEEELQRSRSSALETSRLDRMLEAATAFFELLRSETLVAVQRNNLSVTRSNLELAEIRRSIGETNPAEVYRWRSEIASDRKDLIEAMALRRVSALALARLLHRPVDRDLEPQDVSVDDPELPMGSERLRRSVETPRAFDVHSEFLTQVGLEASPELAELDALLAARARAVTIARRRLFAPTVGLRLSLEERLAESGAGSTGPVLPFELSLPMADETVGVLASRCASISLRVARSGLGSWAPRKRSSVC